MGPGGLLLWPVLAAVAPHHGFARTPTGMPFYTGIFNALGFPAVSVPVGLSESGLPVGVQIIGRPGEDETALAAAAMIEKASGGWRPGAAAFMINKRTKTWGRVLNFCVC